MIHLLSLNLLNEKLPDPDKDTRDVITYTPRETDPVHGYKHSEEIVFKKQFIRGKNRWVLQTPIVMHRDLD